MVGGILQILHLTTHKGIYHLVPNDVLQDKVIMELMGLQGFPV